MAAMAGSMARSPVLPNPITSAGAAAASGTHYAGGGLVRGSHHDGLGVAGR